MEAILYSFNLRSLYQSVEIIISALHLLLIVNVKRRLESKTMLSMLCFTSGVALSMPEFGMQIKFELLKCPVELTVSSSCFKHAEMFTVWITEGIQSINLK